MKNSGTILCVGSAAPTSIEHMYLRAFKKKGLANVDFFDSDIPAGGGFLRRVLSRLTYGWHSRELGSRLHTYLDARKNFYDWIFVFKGSAFSPEKLAEFRRTAGKTKWVNFNPDDPFNIQARGASNRNILNSITFYDVYAIWSKKIRKQIEALGCAHAVYLPFGYDPHLHHKVETKKEPNKKVLFVGTWDREREATLSRLKDFELEIYGNGWDNCHFSSGLKRCIKGTAIYGDEAGKKVASAAVCLNLLRPQNATAHNMKTFEIPAMGGMMLATRSAEQQVFYEEGKMADYFSTAEELLDKLNFYTRHYEHGRRLANAAFLRTQTAGFSYSERAEQLLEFLESIY